MAHVEIVKEYLSPDGENVREPLFHTPNYPETPPPSFIVPSMDGDSVRFTLRQNGSPYSFDIFQARGNLTKDTKDAVRIGEDYYIHAGTVHVGETVFLENALVGGKEVSVYALGKDVGYGNS